MENYKELGVKAADMLNCLLTNLTWLRDIDLYFNQIVNIVNFFIDIVN